MEEGNKIYLQQLYKAFFLSSSQFDKYILTISTGALGLSISFIKDVVCWKCACLKPLIYSSWALFAITMLMSLFAFHFSTSSLEHQIKNFENPSADGDNKFAPIVGYMNIAAIILLFLAVVFLLAFIITNL